MTLITLTTDFGLKDGNVGVMKSVILGIAAYARLVDITHLITPQDVWEGAFILGRSAPYFPDDTIHVAVVDPGVGTARRPIAARLGSQFFVGPDNGLCTPLLLRAEQKEETVDIVHLDKPGFWLPEVSHVFHGRDIFAPIAAHLANCVPLHTLGAPISDPILLHLPEPERTPSGWRGQVIHIDHFGNIATNILLQHLATTNQIEVRLCGQEIHGLVKAFGDRSNGELVSLIGSTGNLLVCLVNGNAAGKIHARRGDTVEVVLLS